MYYETKEGDDEIDRLNKTKLADENEEIDDDDGEPKAKKQKKRRRNEASILEQENAIDQLSNSRPKRAAAFRASETNSGQRRIDDFIAKKRSPKKNIKSLKITSLLPSLPINDSERCPICDRLIANDILEIHTNACLIQNSDAGKELIEKSKQRAKIETKAKEVLFQRITRKSLGAQLIRTNSETTTCSTCGMQMTVSRLENQHKNECSNRLTSS